MIRTHRKEAQEHLDAARRILSTLVRGLEIAGEDTGKEFAKAERRLIRQAQDHLRKYERARRRK